MLKKMRRRFILAAMSAFGMVMLILMIGINLAHDMHLRHSQDEMLERIYDYDKLAATETGEEPPPINEMSWAGGPEREFVLHFFVVHCDAEGNIEVFGDDYITSVDQKMAQAYTRSVLERKAAKGYYEDYRYLVNEEKQEITLIFLNVSEAIEAKKALLQLSVMIGLASLLAVFLLTLALSHPAVRPFVKNMEQQRQFITDAEHELKTPITSIAMSADIAAMEFGENEWIRDIQNQVKRLSGLTNELLILSRLDEESPLLEKTQVFLSEVAWEIVEPFQTRAKACGKQLETNIEEGLTVIGDRALLLRLLSVLLDNAFRYADADSPIRFKLIRCHGGMVCIEVCNKCSQMQKMEDPDRLFDRFFRPDPARTRQTGGSGLGLSIARMIVRAHGGDIHVTLEDDRTVTFTALLKETYFVQEREARLGTK